MQGGAFEDGRHRGAGVGASGLVRVEVEGRYVDEAAGAGGIGGAVAEGTEGFLQYRGYTYCPDSLW